MALAVAVGSGWTPIGSPVGVVFAVLGTAAALLLDSSSEVPWSMAIGGLIVFVVGALAMWLDRSA